MLEIDLVTHLVFAGFWVRLLGWSGRRGELLALALLLALAIKSWEIFVCIALGVGPERALQFTLGLTGAGALGMWFLTQRGYRPLPSWSAGSGSGFWGLALGVGVAVLFGLSLLNSAFFPIMEPDGIWYELRGRAFLHELDLAPTVIHPQYRAYPPFIPLLHAWMLSMGWERIGLVFPLFYLCLVVIFYYGILRHTGNRKTAAMFALVLATTPYYWWHSVQPILNLAAGTWYAVGIMYWFFLAQKISIPEGGNPSREISAHACLSGLCLGMAAWTRPEFILYGAVPLCVLLYLAGPGGLAVPRGIWLKWGVPFLALPTVWLPVVATFWEEAPGSAKAVSPVCAGLWFLLICGWRGWIPARARTWVFAILLGVAGFFVALFAGPGTGLAPGDALVVGLFRFFAFHAFFAFTSLLVLLLAGESWRGFSPATRWLGACVALFLWGHFVVYTLLPVYSTSAVEVFESFRIPLGDAVNSPDTRELLALYPIILLFLAGQPRVREAFS